MNKQRMKWVCLLAVVVLVPLMQGCMGIPTASGGPISGQVIEDGSGKPIADAIVIARWSRTTAYCFHVNRAVTDAEGRYHIPAWEKEYKFDNSDDNQRVSILAYKAGYLRLNTHLKNKQNPLKLDIRPVNQRMLYLQEGVLLGCNSGGGFTDIQLELLMAAYEEARSIAFSSEDKRILLSSCELIDVIATATDDESKTGELKETKLIDNLIIDNLPDCRLLEQEIVTMEKEVLKRANRLIRTYPVFGGGKINADSLESALKQYRQAIEHGHGIGYFYLGNLYYFGEGFTQNDILTYMFWILADSQGFEWARNRLRKIDKRLTPDQIVEARKLARECIAKNYRGCENDALIYLKNKYGYDPDVGVELTDRRRAAERGNAIAQTELGSMYINGISVKQNYILAHMWMSMAAAQGGDSAIKILEMIKNDMTFEEFEEAQKLARECLAKDFKGC